MGMSEQPVEGLSVTRDPLFSNECRMEEKEGLASHNRLQHAGNASEKSTISNCDRGLIVSSR